MYYQTTQFKDDKNKVVLAKSSCKKCHGTGRVAQYRYNHFIKNAEDDSNEAITNIMCLCTRVRKVNNFDESSETGSNTVQDK